MLAFDVRDRVIDIERLALNDVSVTAGDRSAPARPRVLRLEDATPLSRALQTLCGEAPHPPQATPDPVQFFAGPLPGGQLSPKAYPAYSCPFCLGSGDDCDDGRSPLKHRFQLHRPRQ